MIYDVIAYFRSPEFVWHIHSRLVNMNKRFDESFESLFKNTDLTLPKQRWTEQFEEQLTLQALALFIHREKTMACFRRVYMSKASKYVNPEKGLVTEPGEMTDRKLLVSPWL